MEICHIFLIEIRRFGKNEYRFRITENKDFLSGRTVLKILINFLNNRLSQVIVKEFFNLELLIDLRGIEPLLK